MTGAFVDAETALEDGIVTRVHDASELEERVRAFAATLAGKPPLAVRVVKDVVDHSTEVGLADGLTHERAASLPLYSTDDYREGLEAFREDREPQWRGT